VWSCATVRLQDTDCISQLCLSWSLIAHRVFGLCIWIVEGVIKEVTDGLARRREGFDERPILFDVGFGRQQTILFFVLLVEIRIVI